MPAYEFTSWFGVLAPAGTPPSIIKKLIAEIVKALHSPGVSAQLTAQGANLIAETPEAFGVFLKNETAKWAKVIAKAGIQKIE